MRVRASSSCATYPRCCPSTDPSSPRSLDLGHSTGHPSARPCSSSSEAGTCSSSGCSPGGRRFGATSARSIRSGRCRGHQHTGGTRLTGQIPLLPSRHPPKIPRNHDGCREIAANRERSWPSLSAAGQPNPLYGLTCPVLSGFLLRSGRQDSIGFLERFLAGRKRFAMPAHADCTRPGPAVHARCTLYAPGAS
jgi:hypothetical protein